MSEPSPSLHDVKVLSLVDEALAAAVRLWTLRPIPAQRPARIELSRCIEELKKALPPAEFKLIFPKTKEELDKLLRRLA